MVKTLAQLRKEIAEQKRRILMEQDVSKTITERQRLTRELLMLKHRKLIGAGAKATKLSKRFGKVILETGKRVAPVITKQARLIREQQLRDDALYSARIKKRKTPKRKLVKKKVRTRNNHSPFGSFDF